MHARSLNVMPSVGSCSRSIWLLLAAIAMSLGAVRSGLARAPADLSSNEDQALIDRLDDSRVDIDWQPQDLGKAIDQLRDQHNLNFQVAWGVLDKGGVRKDQRIEMRLSQVPLSAVLDNLIREIDPVGAMRLGWGVQRGVIVITQQEALGRATMLKAYDVRDLLESGYAFRRFLSTPVLRLRTTGQEQVGGELARSGAGGAGGGGGGGTGGGGSIFGSPGEDPERLSSMERVEAIVDLIMDHVEPEGWLDNGGLVGSARAHDGVIYIVQTPQNQRKVAQVLDLLRASRPQPLRVEVALLRLSPQRAAQVREEAGERFPSITADRALALAFGAASDGVLFRAGSTAANGSPAWFSDVTQTEVIESMHALVAQQSSVTVPRLGALHDGLELIVLPLLDPDRKRMRLDVQMAFKPPVEISPELRFSPQGAPAAAGPAPVGAPTPDRSRERMRTISSGVALDLGDAVVLTLPDRPDATGRSIQHEEWLVVWVRP